MKSTKAQREAVAAVLSRAREAADREVLIENICEAVLSAEDNKTKYVVITRTKAAGTMTAYGPYGAMATARKAAQSGLMLGDLVAILGMRPVPRKVRGDKAT